jgi:hypothetical protein
MARGDHPQRTPAYGVLLILLGLILLLVAYLLHLSGVLMGLALVVAVVIAIIGFGMTFRDYSH